MLSTLRSCLRACSTCVPAYALALRHLRLTRSSSLVQLFRVQLVVAWFGLQPRDAPVGVHVGPALDLVYPPPGPVCGRACEPEACEVADALRPLGPAAWLVVARRSPPRGPGRVCSVCLRPWGGRW